MSSIEEAGDEAVEAGNEGGGVATKTTPESRDDVRVRHMAAPSIGIENLDWGDHLRRVRRRSRFEFLSPRQPGGAIDPLGERALRRMQEDFPADPDELRERLNEQGTTAQVGELTRYLDGLRMSDVRRHVLARTYVWLLEEVDPNLADTEGAASEVLAKLESNRGPLETFAELLVEEVLTKQRRDPDEAHRTLLVAEIVASV